MKVVITYDVNETIDRWVQDDNNEGSACTHVYIIYKDISVNLSYKNDDDATIDKIRKIIDQSDYTSSEKLVTLGELLNPEAATEYKFDGDLKRCEINCKEEPIPELYVEIAERSDGYITSYKIPIKVHTVKPAYAYKWLKYEYRPSGHMDCPYYELTDTYY